MLLELGNPTGYRHLHISERWKIVFFRVQYETKFKNIWYPVVRYDTSHGFAHRDLFDRRGSKKKTPMFTTDYNEALTFAEYDIKSNWKVYKKVFMGGEENENT